jgi:hypothetical protein
MMFSQLRASGVNVYCVITLHMKRTENIIKVFYIPTDAQ